VSEIPPLVLFYERSFTFRLLFIGAVKQGYDLSHPLNKIRRRRIQRKFEEQDRMRATMAMDDPLVLP